MILFCHAPVYLLSNKHRLQVTYEYLKEESIWPNTRQYGHFAFFKECTSFSEYEWVRTTKVLVHEAICTQTCTRMSASVQQVHTDPFLARTQK